MAYPHFRFISISLFIIAGSDTRKPSDSLEELFIFPAYSTGLAAGRSRASRKPGIASTTCGIRLTLGAALEA